jgi:hypothetical protein
MPTLELLVVEDDLARSFELDGIATIAEETYELIRQSRDLLKRL